MRNFTIIFVLMLTACGNQYPDPATVPVAQDKSFDADQCVMYPRVTTINLPQLPAKIPFAIKKKIWIEMDSIEGWQNSRAYIHSVEGGPDWGRFYLKTLDGRPLLRFRDGEWSPNKKIDLLSEVQYEENVTLFTQLQLAARGNLPKNADPIDINVLFKVCEA